MRSTKNIIFFLFIILMIAALLLNIVILKSERTINIDFLSKLDAIYFKENSIPSDILADLKSFLRSNQTSLFIKIIEEKNPIFKFYAFCGLLNSNQRLAIKYLEKVLTDNTNVKMVINEKKEDTTLGYSIVLLIKNFPEWLTIKSVSTFYTDSATIIYNIYKSDFSSSNPVYKNMLYSLINEKYPEISQMIKKETTVYDDIKNLSIEEKINISKNILNLPEDKKEKIILDLLKENNPTILLNTIRAINENIKDLRIADQLYNILISTITLDITIEAINKFCLLRKNDSVLIIQNYMKTTKNENILTAALKQIQKYGNKDTSYEFLKLYLASPYSPELNLLALETIVLTTFKEDPVNVMRTMLFIINRGETLPAIYAINFHIKNNIGYNNQAILARLNKFENDDMKKLAIKYIEYFNLKEGIPIIEQLTNDLNQDIANSAKELLTKLK